MSESQIYLSFGPYEGVGLLAVLSRGSPQMGDKDVEVLTMEVVKNLAEARAWKDRMMEERPWEQRN